MSIEIKELNHVQITVPIDSIEQCKHFYGVILGMDEIARPANQSPGGAWYELGNSQLHLSIEDGANNLNSRRHICYLVEDLQKARAQLLEQGLEIFADERPVEGWFRFYLRDPGGNRIEIASCTSL